MHIDHSKLVELLAEAAGLQPNKVEVQLAELVTEIQEAIAEGDAYEVTGLGVFSGIGSNIIFIPSNDLATEINYKYVGMEPIEMDAPEEEESLKEEAIEENGPEDDPFAGLLDEEEEKELESDIETTSSFELDKEVVEDTEEPAEEDSEEAPSDLADEEGEEPEEEAGEDYKPGPDEWGIDTYKDESAENMFSGLLGDKEYEAEEEVENQESADKEEDADGLDLASELSKEIADDAEKETEGEINPIFEEKEELESAEGDDFDDPFEALAGDDDEDDAFIEDSASEPSDKEDAEEVVPVIKNLSSEGTKKQHESKKKTEKKAEIKKPSKKIKSPRDTKSTPPVMLWVILIILLIGGSTYGLGYFGVVNIPGITPEPIIATTKPATKTAQQPAAQPEVKAPNTPEATTEQASTETPAVTKQDNTSKQEQAAPARVTKSEDSSTGQPNYGLKGELVPAGNDGYTIVIYHLSKKSSADSKQKELTADGFRVLVAAVPNKQYGTLWRVSLGQFVSLREAAIAAEKLPKPFLKNHLLTKIK